MSKRLVTSITQVAGGKGAVESVETLKELEEKLVKPITSPDEVGKLTEFRARAHEVAKRLESHRKAATEEYRKRTAAINAEAKQYTDELNRIVEACDKHISDWSVKLTAEAAATDDGEQLPAVSPKRFEGSHGSTLTMVDHWTWELEDISRVPDQYLKPPEERLAKSVINARVRAYKDKAEIPGIRAFNQPYPKSQTG